MQDVALEERLLLNAYRQLLGEAAAAACPPALVMASRNDLVSYACRTLPEAEQRVLLDYADSLARRFSSTGIERYPLPLRCAEKPTEAEDRAHAHLLEGSGSLWVALRDVIVALDFGADGRPIAEGHVFYLGSYCKGGAVGVCRHTRYHGNVCRLLNAALQAICPDFAWSTLAVSLNNGVKVHTDRWNASAPCLLVGCSHHDGGELWIEQPGGVACLEHEGTQLFGTALPTSAMVVMFSGKEQRHANLPWSNGDRFVLIAFQTGHLASLRPAERRMLLDFGICSALAVAMAQ
ncbi:rpsF [Symbiodinium necroappetens]|uniref:RpsF protein n=1 Tax=Symbiodinium necroappetens TaxID=1628268 RepID=A0A812QLI3_9DINO|nr:rpsF [Symbiodinium necroappetens]